MRVGGAELVAFVIAQADAAQLHVAVAGGKRRRAWRARQARSAIEHLEDARARCGRTLGEVEDHAERAHRRYEHVHVEIELGELAERQVGVDNFLAAEQEHRRQPELGQEADHGVVSRFQAGGDHRLAEDAPDAVAEPLQLARLAREGLDHAHAGDALLGVCGQLSYPLLGLLDRRPRAMPVAVGDYDYERHGYQHDQRERRVDDEHGDTGQRDREDRLQDEHEPVAEEEAHGLQVNGRARHQLAGLLAVEEAELQALQVAIQTLAQVVLDAERDPPGDQPPPVHEPPTHDHRGEDQPGQDQQPVAVVVARRPVRGAARASRRSSAHRRRALSVLARGPS